MNFSNRLSCELSRIVESKLDPDLTQQAYIARRHKGDPEVGWLGHIEKEFKGQKDKVQIEFDPNDPEIKKMYIYHTHPADEPSPFTALPSEQDLQSAVENLEYGLRGIVVFSGDFYTIAAPIKPDNKIYTKYVEAVKRHDIDDAINELEKIGFDVETGKL